MSHLARRLRTRPTGCCAFLLLAAAPAALADPYVPDPGYNNGQIGADNFAATGYDYRRGEKLVRLDNGDIIVAGVVPGVGSAAGHTKMGLVRYNSAGARQTWSNPGANGFYNNQYVITPCLSTPNWCGDVRDVKGIYRYGDRIFVLADTENSRLRSVGGNPPLLIWTPYPSVDAYVFGTDGSFKGMTVLDSDDYADDESRTVYGGGIAMYDNNMLPTAVSLVYAGTGIVDGLYRPRFARFTVASDSTMTAQTDVVEPAFGTWCDNDPCQFNGIALGGRTSLTAPPRIYVAGARWHPGPNPGQIGWGAGWDAFAASVNSNGTPRTAFSGSGLYDTEGIGSQSGGQKIAVDPGFLTSDDEVFLMANVEQACKDSIAVLKITEAGTTATTFGLGGKVVYGGSTQTNTANCNLGWSVGTIRADYPTDIVYSNGKLGVAGLNIYRTGGICVVGQPCPEDNVDGELAVIDAATGAIESWRGYAFGETPGGARSRHSGFWGIAASGEDAFSVAGDVRYFNSAPADRAGKQMFATLRLKAQGDVIFRNGFD